MKSLLLFIICVLFEVVSLAQGIYPYDKRSDTLHVYHYDIHLDFSDYNSLELKGKARVHFTPLLQSVNAVKLDLLGPDVDSVIAENGVKLNYTKTAANFTVSLAASLGISDSSYFDVYYHGTPHVDGKFGGFYYNGSYAYNVGVSLSDIPHNYGKTWFPCQDNFVNRSTYDVYVKVQNDYNAACGGTLVETTTNQDQTKTVHWKISQPIPSYLASVAVSRYAFINKTFSGVNGAVPVMIAVNSADSTAMNASFQNLEKAFDIYEKAFGPYRWDRVGYSITPMTAGAMEHAMNIAYPQALANGTVNYQKVMAHELSHHWFGDLITCKTAEDMWINEGGAAYCEHIFTEGMSGRSDYESGIRGNHKTLLQYCHLDDEGYWPLSGVPQQHTYGTTVYSKGADMIHTLRGYLGDSLFFSGLQQLFAQNQFSDIDAVKFRDKLGAITGINLTDYFNAWIFQGGWPHVSVDSMKSVQAGAQYNVTLHLNQKFTGRNEYSRNIPVTATFRDSNWNMYKTRVYSDGENNMVTVNVPFNPAMVYLNDDELISQAVTADYGVIKTTGLKSFGNAEFKLNTVTIPDSAWFVAELNWTAPDAIVNNVHPYTISRQRYWRIDGLFPEGFDAKGMLTYSGAKGLDDKLITGKEDSIVLLYRASPAFDWAEYDNYTKSMGNLNDGIGTVTINHLKKGEYAFALKGLVDGVAELNTQEAQIYPNPADKRVKVICKKDMKTITISSINGQILREYSATGKTFEIELEGIASGVYLISGYDENSRLFTQTLVVK